MAHCFFVVFELKKIKLTEKLSFHFNSNHLFLWCHSVCKNVLLLERSYSFCLWFCLPFSIFYGKTPIGFSFSLSLGLIAFPDCCVCHFRNGSFFHSISLEQPTTHYLSRDFSFQINVTFLHEIYTKNEQKKKEKVLHRLKHQANYITLFVPPFVCSINSTSCLCVSMSMNMCLVKKCDYNNTISGGNETRLKEKSIFHCMVCLRVLVLFSLSSSAPSLWLCELCSYVRRKMKKKQQNDTSMQNKWINYDVLRSLSFAAPPILTKEKKWKLKYNDPRRERNSIIFDLITKQRI